MSRRPWATHRQDSTRKDRLKEAKQLGWRNIKVDGIFDDILWHPDIPSIYHVEWKGPKTPVSDTQCKLVGDGFPLFFIETAEQLYWLLAYGTLPAQKT